MSVHSCKSPGLLLIITLVLLGSAEAAYLRNVPVHVRQPDGTVLSLLASGDEFYNWLHDKDGYTIMRNPETGYLVYADKVDGKLVPTPFIAGRADAQSLERAGIPKNLLDDPKPRQKVLAVPVEEPILNAPKTGTINNLVVYIRFADQEEFAEAFIDSTAGFFNSTDSGVNSMRNYYTEASYNQLAISTTFYPGSSPGVYSYQDSYPCAYYIPYDAATNPTGYNGDTERRIREHTLLQNAVNAIAAEVPGGLNIDADGDNYVDNVCFVVKGEPTAWNSLLWPHMWSLYTYNVYINAKRVYTYNFQMETSLNVGVLCHEMFHSLGAPDLYHYSQDGLHPAWAWDLMEYNLDPPEHMTAYMKWKYGTWITSIPEITTSGTYTLNPLKSATNNCYRIDSPFSSTEYFVVEYRKMTGGGTFEGNLYNEGLLVYRINSTVTTGNRLGPPDEVYIYRPNGTTTADGEPWIAPFSANQTRTQINDATNPSSFLTDGSPGGLSISNVGYYGDTISFDVAFNTITVTSPNGGESWPALGNAAVTWMSTGSFGTVDILLSTDGGTNWATLADNTPNDGSETVAVPLIASTACFHPGPGRRRGHPQRLFRRELLHRRPDLSNRGGRAERGRAVGCGIQPQRHLDADGLDGLGQYRSLQELGLSKNAGYGRCRGGDLYVGDQLGRNTRLRLSDSDHSRRGLGHFRRELRDHRHECDPVQRRFLDDHIRMASTEYRRRNGPSLELQHDELLGRRRE